MDNINLELIYKTPLSQRNAAYRYAFFKRDKCNELFNNYYKKNETYRKTKIEKKRVIIIKKK